MNKLRILGLAGVLSIVGVASAGTIAFPVTGQNVVGGLDQNYQIISDTTGLYTGTVPGDAVIVTDPAPQWMAPFAGTEYIGPRANENFPGTTNGGITWYQTTFSLASPANASLDLALLVDNAVTVFLNGIQVGVIGNSDPSYTGFKTPAYVPINSGFISGVNTLQFEVYTAYGPTGLDVGLAPEPSTLTLAGVALAAVGLLRFRKRRAA